MSKQTDLINIPDAITVSGSNVVVNSNITLEKSGNPAIVNKTTGAGNNPLYRLQADTNYWDLQGTFSNANDELFFMYNGSVKVGLPASGGITFNGDTAAANALNDYEEGTWTATGINFTVASITKATYTKIGNIVNVIFWINATSGSGNSNSASISGLPFSIVNKGYTTGSLNIQNANPVTTNIQLRGRSNTTQIDILTANDIGVAGTDVDNGHLIGTLTYETDA